MGGKYEAPEVEIYSLELESAVLTASNAGIDRLEETDFQW